MPLALEPDQTIEISLKIDETKPPETRPAFIVRFMSSRDRRRVREQIDAAMAADNDEAAEQAIRTALQIGLTSWLRLKTPGGDNIPYDPDRLPDLLTDLEMWELVGLLLEKTRLAELDRKNSGSPSAAVPAASVQTVAE